MQPGPVRNRVAHQRHPIRCQQSGQKAVQPFKLGQGQKIDPAENLDRRAGIGAVIVQQALAQAIGQTGRNPA